MLIMFINNLVVTASPGKENDSNNSNNNNSENMGLRSIYATWYPTLEKTLSFLSKLFLSIDVKFCSIIINNDHYHYS
jgi:hypothetical protein